MLTNTDVRAERVDEDVPMPSFLIILAVAIGALNAWLVAPGVSALLGVGTWSGARRSRRLTA